VVEWAATYMDNIVGWCGLDWADFVLPSMTFHLNPGAGDEMQRLDGKI
jgi:hypothetical protein